MGVDDDERDGPGAPRGAALCAREWRGRRAISSGVVLCANGDLEWRLPRRARMAGSVSRLCWVVALGLESREEDADVLTLENGVEDLLPEDEDVRDRPELGAREEVDELLEMAVDGDATLADMLGRCPALVLARLGALLAGTMVELDVLEPVDAVDAWLNSELALETLSARASILRCALSHAAESRFVNDPSSSSLSRGEGGTGVSDVALELAGVSRSKR